MAVMKIVFYVPVVDDENRRFSTILETAILNAFSRLQRKFIDDIETLTFFCSDALKTTIFFIPVT